MQTAAVEVVQREVEALLSRADPQDLQPWLGQLACSLASRSSTDPSFYPASALAALVRSGCLCHRSVRWLQDWGHAVFQIPLTRKPSELHVISSL